MMRCRLKDVRICVFQCGNMYLYISEIEETMSFVLFVI